MNKENKNNSEVANASVNLSKIEVKIGIILFLSKKSD